MYRKPRPQRLRLIPGMPGSLRTRSLTPRMLPRRPGSKRRSAGGHRGNEPLAATPRLGEALNEHILGRRWPSAEERLEMLEEAVQVIRELLTGQLITYTGKHYTVDTARLYSVPYRPPPVFMSGFGEKAIKLAARIADGYMSTMPNAGFVRLYRESGGGDRPVQGGLKVCWSPDEAGARKTVHRLWPTDAIPGEAAQLLPLPRHFAQLAQLVPEGKVPQPCGPDPRVHADAIGAYDDAGFDEVFVSQVGGEAEGFFEFYAGHVLPRLHEG
jgi:G6PDH family F420-dependent oxidoreductase